MDGASTQDVFTEVVGMRTEIRTLLIEIGIIKQRNSAADGIHTDHEVRLRNLQTDVTRLKTIANSIAFVSGIASGILSTVIAHLH